MSILRGFVSIQTMVIILCKSHFGRTKKKRQNEKFYQNAYSFESLAHLHILAVIESFSISFEDTVF